MLLARQLDQRDRRWAARNATVVAGSELVAGLPIPKEGLLVTDSAETYSGMECAGIVARPQGQLQDLPVQFRWEACRRHPYYLVFWSDAHQYRQGAMADNLAQSLLRYAALLVLSSIGVTGDPVPPQTSFEEIGADPAFLSGAIQPMTLRGFATILIQTLPEAERVVLAAILRTSSNDEYAVDDDDENRTMQKQRAVYELARIPSPAFDSYPEALYYIHMGASQRAIVRDIQAEVRRWKQQRGIVERRVPTRNLQSYLDVWDQREGWTGGGYLRSEEHTFAEIARRLRQSPSTVANRYRSAFEMITGHEFSPQLWVRLFGPLKLSELFADPADVLSGPIRRHLRAPVDRPVPESVINPVSQDRGESSIIEDLSAVGNSVDASDLLLDLTALFESGLSDAEIAERMGARNPEEIAYARERVSELRNPL